MKSGDKIKCVDNSGMEEFIEIGKVYTVKRFYDRNGNCVSGVSLEEIQLLFFRATRFVVVNPTPTPARAKLPSVESQFENALVEIALLVGKPHATYNVLVEKIEWICLNTMTTITIQRLYEELERKQNT